MTHCLEFGCWGLCLGAVVRGPCYDKEQRTPVTEFSCLLHSQPGNHGLLFIRAFPYLLGDDSVSYPVLSLWVVKVYLLSSLSQPECLEELLLNVLMSWRAAKHSTTNICHSWCSTPRLTLHSNLSYLFCHDYLLHLPLLNLGQLSPAPGHWATLQ